MHIWYTLTGRIDPNISHQLISWTNGQLFNGQITKLTIFLSSTGGDVDSALRIYSFLKGLPIEVEIIGFSQIDSAANTVFLAGSKRKALAGCRFFLHEGTFNIGNQGAALHVHEETINILQELLKRNIAVISKETGKSIKIVRNVLREGKILSTKQALDFGLVTEIIDKLPQSSGNT